MLSFFFSSSGFHHQPLRVPLFTYTIMICSCTCTICKVSSEKALKQKKKIHSELWGFTVVENIYFFLYIMLNNPRKPRGASEDIVFSPVWLKNWWEEKLGWSSPVFFPSFFHLPMTKFNLGKHDKQCLHSVLQKIFSLFVSHMKSTVFPSWF